MSGREEAPWIEWAGGECPVAAEACVHFRTRFEQANPDVPINEDDERRADSLRWAHVGKADDIIAYRVVQP